MKHRARIVFAFFVFASLWLLAAFALFGLTAAFAQAAPAQALEPTPAPLATARPFLNIEQVALPDALMQALLALLRSDHSAQRVLNPLSANARYVLTSARVEDDWVLISVGALDEAASVPGYVGNGEAGKLLIGQRVNGEWRLGVEGTQEFAELLATAPDDFVSAAAKALLLQPPNSNSSSNSNSNGPEIVTPTVTYKWPWPATSTFYWWQGWHSRSALDMGTTRADRRVLASAGGVVSFICRGKLGAALKIKDADGVTLEYWHIDTKLLDPDVKEGALLVQGQMLGSLRPGTWVDPTCGNQFTQQSANNAHVHWELPKDRPITIDGWTIRQPQSVFTNGTQKRVCVGSCFSSFVSFSSTNVANSGRIQLWLAPEMGLASQGELITVAVGISDARDLGPLQVVLNYSPTQLSVQSIVPGDASDLSFKSVITPSTGTATISSISNITRTGALAYIGIRTESVGTATLKIGSLQTVEISRSVSLSIVPGCAGDYDRDSDVDVLDLQRVAYRWDTQKGDVPYDAAVDTDGDGRINQEDVQRVSNRLGTLCTAAPRANAAKKIFALQIQAQLVALSNTVVAGDVFTVGVAVSDVTSLGALDLALSYSATQFEVMSVDLMDFATSTGRNFMPLDWVTQTVSISNVTHSTVQFGAYSLGAWPAGPSGPGTLVEVTLRALSAGEGDLRLERLQLSDVAGNPQQEVSLPVLPIQVINAAPEFTQQVYLPVLMSDELLPDPTPSPEPTATDEADNN